MRIAEILDSKGHQVYTASPEESVMEAVQRLVAHNIGALAVVDANGHLVGIVSERDVLRSLPREAQHLGDLKVHQRMTREVVTAAPSDDADECLNTMTERRIRHLPVCHHERLIGMISIGDLVKSKLDQAVFETRHMVALVTGQYPA